MPARLLYFRHLERHSFVGSLRLAVQENTSIGFMNHNMDNGPINTTND